jgi:GT2 family glycosyltransferase
MHVAVVIVSFRNPGDVVCCLKALSASDYQDFEVVICENGGPAAFETLNAAIESHLPGGQPVRTLLAPGNLGYGAGVNLGLSAAPGADAWWVLNPDTEPSSAAMSALAARLAKGDCDMAGCAVTFSDGRYESYGGRWLPFFAEPVSMGYGDRTAPADVAALEAKVNYFSGASCMISTRFLSTVGPMREDYFLYCEDVEWGYRASRRGMRFGFAPGASVIHHQGTTTGSYPDLRKRPKTPLYLDTRNKILMTFDGTWWLLPFAASSVLAILFIRCAKRGAWRQFCYGLSGWFAGLRNERGAPDWIGA